MFTATRAEQFTGVSLYPVFHTYYFTSDGGGSGGLSHWVTGTNLFFYKSRSTCACCWKTLPPAHRKVYPFKKEEKKKKSCISNLLPDLIEDTSALQDEGPPAGVRFFSSICTGLTYIKEEERGVINIPSSLTVNNTLSLYVWPLLSGTYSPILSWRDW